MPVFSSSRSVGFKPEDMFALVADVERYPEFLPLCEALKVRRRNALDDHREMLIADMTIGYKAIRETFTSRAFVALAVNDPRPLDKGVRKFSESGIKHRAHQYAEHA